MKGEFSGEAKRAGGKRRRTRRGGGHRRTPSRPSGALGRFVVRAFAALVMDHAFHDLALDAGVRRELRRAELPYGQTIRGRQSLHRFEPDLLFARRLQLFRRDGAAFAQVCQFSTRKPATRLNSPTLRVTRVAPRRNACAAMSVSIGPMPSPRDSKSWRMAA